MIDIDNIINHPSLTAMRYFVVGLSITLTILAIAIVWYWHHDKNDPFDLRDLIRARDPKTKKQYVSRAALGELVAMFATTSAYLSVISVQPAMYPESTLIYAGIWAVRGGYATYLRARTQK